MSRDESGPVAARQDEWWRDFFVEEFGELQLRGAREDRSAEDADFVEKALRLSQADSILDAPCGTGRIALELAARGFAVTGVDFNPHVVEAARARAVDRGLHLDVHVGDVRELDFGPQFEAVVCFWGSFGYFDEAGDVAFASGVAQALKPGGRFLIETHALESLLPRYTSREWSTHSDERGGTCQRL